jgi:hypothetical protein
MMSTNQNPTLASEYVVTVVEGLLSRKVFPKSTVVLIASGAVARAHISGRLVGP